MHILHIVVHCKDLPLIQFPLLFLSFNFYISVWMQSASRKTEQKRNTCFSDGTHMSSTVQKQFKRSGNDRPIPSLVPKSRLECITSNNQLSLYFKIIQKIKICCKYEYSYFRSIFIEI